MSAIVVTGAAGNLGRRVTQALAARPGIDRVFAVDRSPLPATPPKVEAHVFDLRGDRAADELAALAKTADAFLNLAWQPDRPGNLSVVGNVLDAAEAAGATQVVHLSSATVYGAWPDNPVPMAEEVAPRPNPDFAYAVEKRAAEDLVERWAHAHPEVAVAVLRPACTVGSTEQPLYQALATTARAPLGERSRMVQYLHIDDLASAVMHAWDGLLTGTYNVAPDGGVDEHLAGALAGGAAAVPLPSWARSAWSDWSWPLRRGVPAGARAYAEHSWVVAADKLRATGWCPEYTSEEALVVSDERAHWDDMPTSRRVAAALAGVAVVAAGAVGAGGSWYYKHRR
jgi:UDP-glucose 4-epimerase